MNLQTWDLEDNGYSVKMIKDPDGYGDWVYIDDVKELQKENEKLKEEIEKLQEQIKKQDNKI